jgi:hypothetical protein
MTDRPAPAPMPSTVGFHHAPHPRIAERRHERPARTDDGRVGINGRIGLAITAVVGTMWAAYLFVVIAAVGAFAIIGNLTTLNLVVILISQTFLQLVLLPVIIVGQNLQGRAADKRSEQTYKDAEAILHECLQLQEHLQAQDQILERLIRAARPAAPGTA